MAIVLAPFDATRDFVCQTFFRADGWIWQRGEPFDKSRVTTRVLRQLYEYRRIGYAEDAKRRKPAAQPPAPVPAVSEMEQAEKLAGEHTKAQLLDLAKDVEGVKPDMTKTAIALALVRAGHGNS